MNMPRISIRAVFQGATLVVVLLLLALLDVAARIGDTKRAMVAATEQRFDSEQAADELRDSSNQRTQMARLYVDTGDRRYLDYYNDILSNRSGQARRLRGSRGVYWDLVMAGVQPHPTSGEKQSFVGRLLALGFSADEFALLRETQRQSEYLVVLEQEAFAAMEGRFLDANGTLTRAGPSDRDYARSLLNGSRYLEAKAKVMAPIGEFAMQVTQRTGEKISQLAEQQAYQIALALSLLALTLVTVFATYAYVSRNILRPIQALDRQARTFADGDYSARNDVAVRNELGVLGRAMNLVSTATQFDLEARERVRAALQESEARFRAFFDQAAVGVAQVALDGRWLLVNQRLCDIVGYPGEELLAKTFRDITYPEDLEKDQLVVRKLLADEVQNCSTEKRYVCKDESLVWVNLTASLVRGPGREAQYFIVVVEDITEHKRVEEEIRKQEELTSQIIEAIPMGVFWKDRALRFLGCNTAFARNAGYVAPADVIGKDDFQMAWREQAEIYRADDQRVMAADAVTPSYDEPQTTPLGDCIWVRTSKVPLHNEVNEVVGLLGIHEDITRWKNSEIALRASEERFRTIFDNATDGILIVDAGNYKLLLGNSSMCRMLGYAPEEIKALRVMDIHPEKDLPDVMREFDLHEEGAWENFAVKRKDGSVFYADITVAYFENGDKRYQAGFFRDITERKRAEQLLREREADFTAIVEHSPVAMIVSTGADDEIIVMNQKFTELFGYTLKDVPDVLHWWAFAYPDEQYREEIKAKWTGRVEKAIENHGKIESMEATVACKDGSKRIIKFSFATIGNRHIITFDDLTARKEMETALRESEARYRGIFEAVDDVIYTIESDGTFSSLSPSFERMTGWLPEEWIGKHFTPLAHPDDLPHMHELFGRLLSGETLPPAEMRLMTKAGTYLEAELKPSAIRRGDSITVFGVLRDITERKRMDELMRRQMELNTQIIETVPMRVFWKDLALRYVGCNAVFARDAGYDSPGDLIGKDDFQMGWREQAEIYRADDRRVIDANELKLSYDEPQTTPAGERIWLRTSKVPLHDEVNEVIGLLGTYEDITERKNVEIALGESEERFRMAFQTSAIGMALVGLDGRWLKVNNSLCRIVGYSEQELLGKTFQGITHPDDLESDLVSVTQLLAGKISHYQMEKRYFHKDGHVVWVRLSVALIGDAQGSPIHFVAQIEDITEEKHVAEKIRRLNEELEIKVQERTRQLLDAQEELVRKEKLSLLGQVADTVGHELRNPLGVMSNAVYFLQTVLFDADETTKDYLGIIKDEIAEADRIVSDLLDAVRTKPPKPETVNVAERIEQTLCKCDIPASVTVKLDIPEALPALRVDPMHLKQVLWNLITNAVEAMPDGGTLEIRAAANAQAETVRISVKDTGVGIATEQLGTLFQPLSTTKARSIGLGLVVVKNLTQANGGSVEVESAPGVGSTFAVTLPVDGAS